MLYTLNLHGDICQLYFSIKQEKNVNITVFPSLINFIVIKLLLIFILNCRLYIDFYLQTIKHYRPIKFCMFYMFLLQYFYVEFIPITCISLNAYIYIYIPFYLKKYFNNSEIVFIVNRASSIFFIKSFS